MKQAVSLHQFEKMRPKKYSLLHDKMIAEAELIVRHNWSDIAIHDGRKLRSIPENHFCAWVIGEFGSYLTPLYCDLDQRAKWEASPLAPIQILCMRWLQKENPLTSNSRYMNEVGPFYQKCFLLRKNDCLGGGDLIPITFSDLMDLSLNGKYWSLIK